MILTGYNVYVTKRKTPPPRASPDQIRLDPRPSESKSRTRSRPEPGQRCFPAQRPGGAAALWPGEQRPGSPATWSRGGPCPRPPDPAGLGPTSCTRFWSELRWLAAEDTPTTCCLMTRPGSMNASPRSTPEPQSSPGQQSPGPPRVLMKTRRNGKAKGSP